MSSWSFTDTGKSWIHYTFTVSQSKRNVADNTSTISYSCVIKKDNTGAGQTSGTCSYKVYINGSAVLSKSNVNVWVNDNSSRTFVSGTTTVSHNVYGKKEDMKVGFSISGWLNGDPGWKYMDLTPIDRVATITTSSSGTLGSNITITPSVKSSSLTHEVTAIWNGQRATIKGDADAKFTWAPPISWCTAGSSGTCTITCTTKSGSTTIGSSKCTTSLSRPATSTLTVSINSFDLDGSNRATLTTSAINSNYTKKIYYTFTNTSGNQTAGLTTTAPASTSASTATFTPPITLLNNIPNANSGTATVFLQTLYGSTVLSTVSKSITLNVPDYSIEANESEYSDAAVFNGTTPLSRFGSFVQNKSILQVSVSGIYSRYGATISKATLTFENKTYDMSLTLTNGTYSGTKKVAIITSLSSPQYRIVYTDSRGKTVSEISAIPVISYKTPSITLFAAQRATSTGDIDPDGEKAVLHLAYNVTSLKVNNVEKNTIRRVTIKQNETSLQLSWTPSLTIDNETHKSGIITSIDRDKKYVFSVEVTDWFNEKATLSNTIYPTFTLINFAANGKGLAIGGISNSKTNYAITEDTTRNPNKEYYNQSATNSYDLVETVRKLYQAPKTKTWQNKSVVDYSNTLAAGEAQSVSLTIPITGLDTSYIAIEFYLNNGFYINGNNLYKNIFDSINSSINLTTDEGYSVSIYCSSSSLTINMTGNANTTGSGTIVVEYFSYYTPINPSEEGWYESTGETSLFEVNMPTIIKPIDDGGGLNSEALLSSTTIAKWSAILGN